MKAENTEVSTPSTNATNEVDAMPMAGKVMPELKAMEGKAMATPEPIESKDPALEQEAAVMVDDAVEQEVMSEPKTPVKSGSILNPNTATVMAVQQALSDKGYYFGAIDGKIGTEALNALYLYQSAHRMDVSGLTYETLDKLGITVVGE